MESKYLTPEKNLILRIIEQWGNAATMGEMEQWLKDYAAKAQQGPVWVKASERPGINMPVKWREGETEMKVKPVWYMVLDTNSEYLSKCEWLDESAAGREDAVEFAEWCANNYQWEYDPTSDEYRWLEANNFYTTAELYDIFKQQKIKA